MIETEERSVGVVSLTRTAAREVARRTGLPREQVGTLHSMAYHAIGAPPLVDLRAWNAQAPEEWRASADEDEWAPSRGGSLWSEMQRARAAREPMPEELRDLAEAWAAFKYETGTVDFCDMLERALGVPPPRGIEALIVDEAQDLSRLGWELVQWWGQWLGDVVVAGDPAQAIYTFAGASPDPLLEPGWEEVMLERSHRLPEPIVAYAEGVLLPRHSGPLGEGRWYQPTAAPGEVLTRPFSLAQPLALLGDAMPLLAGGLSVMVLASAQYMLGPLLAACIEEGVLVANPWRPSQGSWNPLRRTGRGVATVDRVGAILRGIVEPEDVMAVLPLLPASAFAERGVKTRLAKEITDGHVAAFWASLTDEARDALRARDLLWVAQHAPAQATRSLMLAHRVLDRWGTIEGAPRLLVGTIHSVKGGEADVVYLAPDISPAAAREGDDELVRMFYVGATRARRSLRLLDPAGLHYALT
jgi:hypothetical protein